MQVPEEAAVAASGLQAAREDQLRGCVRTCGLQQCQQRRQQRRSRTTSSTCFVLRLDGIQGAFQQQLTLLQSYTR